MEPVVASSERVQTFNPSAADAVAIRFIHDNGGKGHSTDTSLRKLEEELSSTNTPKERRVI